MTAPVNVGDSGFVTDISYDAGDIQVLEGLDPVRKRPGMYIGSTGSRGLHHLVYEVVDNSVDEALIGSCSRIEVTILPDSSVRVTDDGRGIPVKVMPQYGRPALEIVMTKLHAGGKFGGGGYKVSGGLHGVGVSVVNALSEWLVVEVCRDGHRYRQPYARGVPEADVERVGRCVGSTGTTVHFRPDPEIFDDLNYNFSTLAQRLREVAFLNSGLHISLVDERVVVAPPPDAESPGVASPELEREEGEREGQRQTTQGGVAETRADQAVSVADEPRAAGGTPLVSAEPRQVSFCYRGGIVDFVHHINAQKDAIHDKVIFFGAKEEDYQMELAMQWNAGYLDNVFSFANNINTPEGGTHLSGVRAAITRTLNEYARSKGLLKEKERTSLARTWREGLAAILSVKLRDPIEGRPKPSWATRICGASWRRSLTKGWPSFSRRTPPTPARSSTRCWPQPARGWRPARPATDASQERSGEHHAPGQTGRLRYSRRSGKRVVSGGGDSARRLGQAGARPQFQAILPCGARSSTWRRPGSARSSPT